MGCDQQLFLEQNLLKWITHWIITVSCHFCLNYAYICMDRVVKVFHFFLIMGYCQKNVESPWASLMKSLLFSLSNNRKTAMKNVQNWDEGVRSVLLSLAQWGRQLYVEEAGSLEGSEGGFIAAVSPKRQLPSTALLLLLLVNFN